MMFGIHGGEEIGGGFVVGLFLLAAPVDEQAVAEAAKHADDAHGVGLAHPAEIVEVGDIQALMQAGFDAPGCAIELEPLLGVEFFRGQAGHERDGFGTVVAQVALEQGDLFDTREVHRLARGGLATEHAPFGLAFVELTPARQRRGGLARGKNPPEGREPVFRCSA
jgi:hypothetical protein